ncbi:MAG: HI0074 family nucleotidyltransferase substrate-binding subunit [bacterium]
MGIIKLKHEQLYKALDRLQEAVEDFERVAKNGKFAGFTDQEKIFRTFRDSMIQRFEFCVDLSWKYLKRYLEEELKQIVDINAPKPVIRMACKAKLIEEVETQTLLEMINDRNLSSHIYKEEIADQISSRIKKYYELMRMVVDRLCLRDN